MTFLASSTVGRPTRRLGFGVLVLSAMVLAAGCKHQPPKEVKLPKVVVAYPETEEIVDYQDFTGRIDALKTVDIRPRVSGYITQAPFTEGDLVKEGALLFQIDPRTYQDDLDLAEANLKQAEAELVLQTKRAERGIRLINSGSGAIGPEDYDQLVAARDKAKATVSAMKATRDRAKLFLDFTRVTAPPLVDDDGKPLVGRISRRQVDPGNLVNADQTILTTLVSVDRMYAYFDVDERTYLELATLADRGTDSSFSSRKFPVMMRLANEEEFAHKGYVNFLDNRLNANTGTVRMRGWFDNPKELLKSGLFVRIRLPIAKPYKAVIIPDEAVLSDQGRKHIYVVEKGKNAKGEEAYVVKYRNVVLGQSLSNYRAIKEGLKKDEMVIVSGLQKVHDNSEVQIEMSESSKPPQSPLIKQLQNDRTVPQAHSTEDGAKGEGRSPVSAINELKSLPNQNKGHSKGGKK